MHFFITTDTERLEAIDFEPTMAIGFYREKNKEHFAQQCKMIKTSFPDLDLIGCSGESVITNDPPYVDVKEEYESIFVFMGIKREAYSLHVFYDRSFEASAFDLDPEKVYSTILFSTNSSQLENDTILNTLKKRLGISNIFGALAGNGSLDYSSSEVSLYHNGKFYSVGYLFLIIDEAYYNVKGYCLSTFEPIGIEMVITKTDNKSILEIEGMPALSTLENIMGRMSDEGIKKFQYPFYVWNPKIICPNLARPLRTVTHIDRSNDSLHFFNPIEEGNMIKVAIATNQMVEKRKLKELSHQIPDGSLNLLFICIAQKFALNSEESLRLMYLARSSEQSGFVGFHTFGEIVSRDSKSDCTHLHNQTITYITLSDSEKAPAC